ncbi:hypothetical protein GQX74_000372 [Glossina fuscipes]|nr:hypothetical protein GQX74_000372 [Glossina fuscipes]
MEMSSKIQQQDVLYHCTNTDDRTYFSSGGGGISVTEGVPGGVFSFSIMASGASSGGKGLTEFVSILNDSNKCHPSMVTQAFKHFCRRPYMVDAVETTLKPPIQANNPNNNWKNLLIIAKGIRIPNIISRDAAEEESKTNESKTTNLPQQEHSAKYMYMNRQIYNIALTKSTLPLKRSGTVASERYITDNVAFELVKIFHITGREHRLYRQNTTSISVNNLVSGKETNLRVAFLYDPTPERKASDRGYEDIEKEDTYNLWRHLISYVCNNSDWDEDDDDIFASISTQEVVHQDVKVNNNFPHTSKFPVNKQITQGNQRDNISGYSKTLVLRETNVALGLGEGPELGEGKNAVGVNVISIENESEEVKSKVIRDEVGKVNNPESSLVSAGFQTANGKKNSISKKRQIFVQNILREFQHNLQETNYETELKDIKARMSVKSMESKFGKTTNSSAQVANKTDFLAMCEKGKKTFKHSTRVNEAFIEN